MTVLPDGTVRYVAVPSFVGEDAFTYVVTDGAASATGTVTVKVSPPLDSDGDGIPDYIEDSNHNGTVDTGETDPRNPDTDGDGLPDGVEDSNHDGTVDQGETDPRNPDTNGDGILDGIGVRGGGCGSGPGGAASLLLVGMAVVLRRRAVRGRRRGSTDGLAVVVVSGGITRASWPAVHPAAVREPSPCCKPGATIDRRADPL